MPVGDSVMLSASARDASGAAVPEASIDWTVEPSGSIRLTGTGAQRTATAVAPGSVLVRASVGGRSATSTITVLAPPAPSASLSLVTDSSPLRAGTERGVRAVLIGPAGDTLSTEGILWTMERDGPLALEVLAPTAFAVVTGVRPGVGRVHATIGNLAATLTVDVTPEQIVSGIELRTAELLVEPGIDIPLVVQAWGADGGVLSDVDASWISSDPTVATVTGRGATAALRGLREGTVTVRVAAGGRRAVGTIRVQNAPPLARVVVAPADAGAWVGGLHRFRAIGGRPNGTVVESIPLAWRVEDPTVATIEADGLLLARAPGVTRVFARSGAVEGFVQLRVYPTPNGPMTFDLDADASPDGVWRPIIQIGDTLWTDADGVVHPAGRFLVGGVLGLDPTTSTWTQTLHVDVIVSLPGGATTVGREILTDAGGWTFSVPDPAHLRLVSARAPSTPYTGTWRQAGLFVLEQPVGHATRLGYVWRLR